VLNHKTITLVSEETIHCTLTMGEPTCNCQSVVLLDSYIRPSCQQDLQISDGKYIFLKQIKNQQLFTRKSYVDTIILKDYKIKFNPINIAIKDIQISQPETAIGGNK